MAIEARGLARSFGSTRALDGIDLVVPRGCTYGLLGPNGSGKTTILRLILGLLRADCGTIAILGEQLSDQTLYRRIGALIDRPVFYPNLSGRDNLRVMAACSGQQPTRARARIDEVLSLVGLVESANRPVRGFSTGMKQRLGIALALLWQPDVLILDEPTDGLDPAGIGEVRQIVEQASGRGTTVLLSSHALDEIERVCDRVAILKNGRVVREGSIESILAGDGRVSISFGSKADAAKGSATLAAAGWTVMPGRQETDLVAFATDHDSSAIGRTLADAQIYPSSLLPFRPTLESIFLDVTANL